MLISLAKVVVKVVPESAGAALTRAMASLTRRPPVSAFERESMTQASQLQYGENGGNVAWAWGEGRLVIFVHGWGGRAAQMAPLAAQVARLGFRSIAIDVTGHGDSPKWRTSWADFLNDIAALSQSLHEEIYAYVGHSAGGLAVMAARQRRGIHAPRYFCVAAPSYPFPMINAIERKLNPGQAIVESCKTTIAKQFGTTWEQLQNGVCFENAGPDLLLCYDEADRFVDHSEGNRIQSLCPGARLVKTRGYGHQNILAAPELARAMSEFLNP